MYYTQGCFNKWEIDVNKGEITFGGKPIGEIKSITVNRDIDLTDAGGSECITIKGKRELTLILMIEADIAAIECNGKRFVPEK